MSNFTDAILKGKHPIKPSVSGDTITALVDGDLIAYRAAAATDGKFYVIGKEKIKYWKDVKKHCEKYGIDLAEAKPVYETEPLSFAVNNMKRALDKTVVGIMAKRKRPVELVVYLTSDSLFRYDISPLYKKSREGLRRPTNLKGCKAYLEQEYGAETISGYEADDLIAIHWHQGKPTESVVVSLDKDLRQLHGFHYDFVKHELYTVSKQEARVNFWTQALTGDKTDDIIGLHGVGPVTAEKLLSHLDGKSSDHEYYQAVVKAYVEWEDHEEGETKEAFYTRILKRIGKNCRLLWLCREPEVLWDAPAIPTIGMDPAGPEADYTMVKP